MAVNISTTIPESQVLNSASLIAFPTKIGWIGLLHVGYELQKIKIGLGNPQEVLQEFVGCAIGPALPGDTENLWIDDFHRYLAGEPVSFEEFSINSSGMTRFQRRVVEACRRIPFGETLSYGELAAEAGSPNAARAVGTVMSNNPFPLVVPCHRVVARNGLGGFSAPGGTQLKLQLLAMEGTANRFLPTAEA